MSSNDKIIIEQLKDENRQLHFQIDRIMNTRAMRINSTLENYPIFAKIIEKIYDQIAKIWKETPSDNELKPELIINDFSNKIIAICHPYWQGVRSAAEGQSPNLLLLPELSPNKLKKAVDLIKYASPTHIILNGYWRGYDDFAIEIKKSMKDIKIFYVHHGSFYQMLEDRRMPDILSLIVTLYKKGVISKIAFVKDGMAETFRYFGIESQLLLNRVSQSSEKIEQEWHSPIKIFIPATDHLRKNLHTQIMAALMIDEIEEIHIIGPVNLVYLRNSKALLDRIIIHPKLNRKEVLKLISESTFVLYVTLSECAPMIPLECLSQNIPCLTGNNHGLFLNNFYLKDILIVKEEDNPISIMKSIIRIKENYKDIKKAIFNFNYFYDQMADESMQSFLFN